MATHDLFEANLHNLSAFWRALGADTISSPSGAALHRSVSWPHRLWHEADHRAAADDRGHIVTTATAGSADLTVPIWLPSGADHSEAIQLRLELERVGFALSFAQTTMHVELDEARTEDVPPSGIHFTDGRDDVPLWTDVAARSFGYAIDARAVTRLCESPHAHLVVADRAGASVGTGLLFRTGEVGGIHMVGVPPEARRAGVAGAVMSRLLDDARRLGCRRATLQASTMGEGLYVRLGFAVSGHVENLRRPQPDGDGRP